MPTHTTTGTVATLTIDAFRTTLTFTADGQPGERHNILGTVADGDWNIDHIAYLRNAADRQLAALGYIRTGKWEHHRHRDVHTADITPAGTN